MEWITFNAMNKSVGDEKLSTLLAAISPKENNTDVCHYSKAIPAPPAPPAPPAAFCFMQNQNNFLPGNYIPSIPSAIQYPQYSQYPPMSQDFNYNGSYISQSNSSLILGSLSFSIMDIRQSNPVNTKPEQYLNLNAIHSTLSHPPTSLYDNK